MKKTEPTLLTLLLLTFSLFIGIPFIIQPIDAEENTKFAIDDRNGGDCAYIGNWNSTTKTCTLTNDLTGNISINSNGITLDGNSHVLKGEGAEVGIHVSEKVGVTIKNVNVEQFAIGIYLDHSNSNIITNNTANGNTKYGIYLFYSSTNTITDNISNRNGWYGIYLDYLSNYNTISDNIANQNKNFGIYIHTSTNNSLTGNVANSNTTYGIYLFAGSNNNVLDNNIAANNYYGVYLFALSNNNVLKNNIVADNYYGIYINTSIINDLTSNVIIENNNAGIILQSSNNNEVYKNTFINNPTHIMVRNSYGNVFNLATPIGGNYWSDYNTAKNGCDDANADGFCDAPFVFKGGQDGLPWQKDAWGH